MHLFKIVPLSAEYAARIRETRKDDIDLLIPEIFELHPEVSWLHARNAEACCFICSIERVDN